MHLTAKMQYGAKLYQKLNLQLSVLWKASICTTNFTFYTAFNQIYHADISNLDSGSEILISDSFPKNMLTNCLLLQSRKGMHYSLTYQVHVHLEGFN